MQNRILEISSPGKLSAEKTLLVFASHSGEITRILFEELAAIILSNNRISLSQAVLTKAAENRIAIISCGLSYLPVSLSLPIAGHSIHAKVIRAQVQQTTDSSNLIWQCIVKEKIFAQVSLLYELDCDYNALLKLLDKVTPGDTSNYEAQAARIYWRELFGKFFRRDPEQPGINTLLNFGYSIIRSALARALVGVGLHPALGIHHCNKRNPYQLVDDLIEPLRTLVDKEVKILSQSEQLELDSNARKQLINILFQDVELSGSKTQLLEALNIYALSFREMICGTSTELMLPKQGYVSFKKMNIGTNSEDVACCVI